MNPELPFLKITGPDGQHRIVQLTKTRISIGRNDPPSNDIALQPDPYHLVSREGQCYLEQQGSNWYVCEGHGRNPTFLSRRAGLCQVQDKVLLTNLDQIYIQGGLTKTNTPLFFGCQFCDPEGTEPGQSTPHLEYDWSSHRLFKVAGEVSEPIHLSPREDNLIRCLWERNEEHHASSLVSVSELKQAIWGAEAMGHGSEEVHKLISFLREKIELDPEKPQFLKNEHKKGYLLDSHPLPDISEERRDSDA